MAVDVFVVLLKMKEALLKTTLAFLVFLISTPYGFASVVTGSNQQMSCSSNDNSTCNLTGMASIEVYCDGSGMKLGFNMTELKANILPFKIYFNNSNCAPVNETSVGNMGDGNIWLWSNYSDCGIEAYDANDNKIIFETDIMVEYGSKSASQLIYRYFEDTYKVQCILDRNVTKELQLNVKDRKTISTSTNQTVEYELDFKVFKSDGTEVNGLVYIGEKLNFKLNLPESYTALKSSPQDCYTTRIDNTGRYNLITDRCVGDDDTVKILTKTSDTHNFEWEMLAFRYFGNSDGVYVTCKVLVCRSDDSSTQECQRCGARRRRSATNDDGVIGERFIRSRPIFIIERGNTNTGSQPGTSDQQGAGFLSKPEGTAIIVVIATLVLLLCVVVIKKVFFTSAAAAAVGKAHVVGFNNAALE